MSEEIKEINQSVSDTDDDELFKYDGLGEISERDIKGMLKMAQDSINMFEGVWNGTREEFGITDNNIKDLYDFNEKNKKPMPAMLSEQGQAEWDHFNGLDKLTYDDVAKIFGAQHKIIIPIDQEATNKRIKECVEDYFNWLSALRTYETMEQGYLQIMELRDEQKMVEYKMQAQKEEDPEKKEEIEKLISDYYYNKHLDFLAEELPKNDFKRIVDAYGDQTKIKYWMSRSKDKLSQLGISAKFIPEVSKFEDRFIDEKYHKTSNILLLYCLYKIAYVNIGDENDSSRQRIIALVIGLDHLIRNIYTGELREKMMANIISLEEQFYDTLVSKYFKED